MKKIICKKEYDTETATVVKKNTYGYYGDPACSRLPADCTLFMFAVVRLPLIPVKISQDLQKPRSTSGWILTKHFGDCVAVSFFLDKCGMIYCR